MIIMEAVSHSVCVAAGSHEKLILSNVFDLKGK